MENPLPQTPEPRSIRFTIVSSVAIGFVATLVGAWSVLDPLLRGFHGNTMDLGVLLPVMAIYISVAGPIAGLALGLGLSAATPQGRASLSLTSRLLRTTLSAVVGAFPFAIVSIGFFGGNGGTSVPAEEVFSAATSGMMVFFVGFVPMRRRGVAPWLERVVGACLVFFVTAVPAYYALDAFPGTDVSGNLSAEPVGMSVLVAFVFGVSMGVSVWLFDILLSARSRAAQPPA